MALAKSHQEKWVLWIHSSLLPKTPQMGNNGKGIQTTIIVAYKKELREEKNSVNIARWMYEVAIPFYKVSVQPIG